MIARMHYQADYLFRLVTQDGKVYPIPSRAVLSAPASASVNSPATWEMPVSIMASMLPRGVAPQQYHGIEVDRLMKGNRMPYFRGLIDEVRRGWGVENGVRVQTMEMQAFGVLQRTKGYRVDSLQLNPVTQDGDRQMMGLGKWITWAPGTLKSPGGTDQIPYGGATLGEVFILPAPATGPAYQEGTDYTVDRTKIPIVITWITTPATTRQIWYDKLERFVVPYLTATRYLTLPPGRDYNDLYHTYVLDFLPGSPDKIRVADRTGYGTEYAIPQDDYLIITTSDGTEHIIERGAAADLDGWMDLQDPLPSGIAKGDPVRLPTTEAFSAWADNRYLSFAKTSDPNNPVLVWNSRLFKAYPQLGYAVPTPRVWSDNEDVYIGSFLLGNGIGSGFGYIREDVDANRIEEVVKYILTTETGLFDPSEIVTEPTGVYVKNRTWSGIQLPDLLSEFKDQAMSPNTFVHDTQDGKVTIKPYRQKPKPDWVMRGIQRVEETEVPEPITAVTVIAEAAEPVNLAGEWIFTVEGAEFPERITDQITSGGPDVPTGSDTPDGHIGAIFQIPRPEPSTAHPLISEIRITATGQVTMFFSEDLSFANVWILPGMSSRQIDSGTVTIGSEEIARAITTDAGYLVVIIESVVDGDTMAGSVEIPATCSEIEILTKKAGYWRAALTDDTDLAPADQGPNRFGTIWRQPDPTKRMSYRYAPTSYLKRVQVLYPDKARDEVKSMAGISQQDTRDYAERWQDERVRAGNAYTVIAPYDDRAELGDTVHVAWEGFSKNLLLWGIQGPANPREVMATYTFHDYGL
jgi:hypothetical protein